MWKCWLTSTSCNLDAESMAAKKLTARASERASDRSRGPWVSRSQSRSRSLSCSVVWMASPRPPVPVKLCRESVPPSWSSLELRRPLQYRRLPQIDLRERIHCVIIYLRSHCIQAKLEDDFRKSAPTRGSWWDFLRTLRRSWGWSR